MRTRNIIIAIAVLGAGFYAYKAWKRKQYKEVVEDGSFTIYIKE
jgi:hypothetical protein